jgi:response regulator RpfG family c-di-GMP phosphodiesterase
MLTGNADQQAAMDAVNRGGVFRFLTKPCATEALVQAIESAFSQYDLARAETDILDRTLLGTIGVLTEILVGVQPVAFNRAARIRSHIRACCAACGLSDSWQIELAALLAPIGQLTLPSDLASKIQSGAALSEQESAVVVRLPEIGSNLLKKIPRMDAIARTIAYSGKYFNGQGYPCDRVVGKDIPAGAWLLKILSDFVDLENGRRPRSVAVRIMHTRIGWYDPEFLAAVSEHLHPPRLLKLASSPARTEMELKAAGGQAAAVEETCWEVALADLSEGDVLVEDVCSRTGTCLLSAGTVVTEALHERLQNLAALRGIREPLRIIPGEESV